MHSYTKLAKSAVEQYVKSRQVLDLPDYLPAELTRQQACHVYLFEKPGRRIRASYGQPLPRTRSLAQEIITNTITALAACRYRCVRRPELTSIVYTIAVLEPLQRISHESQLDPEKFGLFIRSDRGKSSVLLPQRAGIETAQDQVATVLRESGINLRHETAVMYRFAVAYYD